MRVRDRRDEHGATLLLLTGLLLRRLLALLADRRLLRRAPRAACRPARLRAAVAGRPARPRRLPVDLRAGARRATLGEDRRERRVRGLVRRDSLAAGRDEAR